MGMLIALLINLGLTYFIYLDGQKREVKKSPLWTVLSFVLPYIVFIFYLVNRPKNIVTNDIVKAPYGFRSKNKFKMVGATLAYLFHLL